MLDLLRQKLESLTQIPGVSGHEIPIVRYLMEVLPPSVDALEVDAMGNVMTRTSGNRPGPQLMLAAHSDQIGAVVSHIDDTGFLRFNKVGGTLDALLLGRKVRVGEIPGIIGVKPGHYQTREEREKVVPASKMYIDVGCQNAEAVRALGIEVGSPVTYQDSLTFLQNGHQFAGAGVDNRVGCAVLWQVLERIADGDFGGTLWGVFTAQEEVGLKGAGVAAHRIQPDFALAIDTVPCGGTPDVNPNQLPTDIGLGPVFPWVTGSRGQFSTPPQIRKQLLETANAHDIPHQIMIFAGGGNDASTMQLAGDGIPSGSITLPRRYSHSPVEMGDLHDMVNAVKLIDAIVREMETHTPQRFI